ncbi:MAG: esterase family protein [Acidobacteriota bacterium]|nr:esterase family protein [Acidobacteriota bacterium]
MKNRYFSLALLLGLIAFSQIDISAAERIRFQIGIDTALFQNAKQPVSGRLLIFMTNQATPLEMIEPDFLDPRSVWIAGMEVRNLIPGQPIDFDPDALAFPAPFSTAPSGDYQLMALLDTDHSYTYEGTGAGDLYSAVVIEPKLNPSSSGAIKLTLTKQVPERKLANTASIKLVNFESPSLTAFWGRPIKMRAGVVLPPSYAKSRMQRYPTVYVVHGYGGSHETAWRRGPDQIKKMSEGKTPEMVYVYLDASFSLGHHVFADSVNNGPWGRALTTELIPYLEKQFRMDAVPQGRLLTGHSSGGWSTLWLEVNYPGVFGATWSTSPDPVDFHNFTGPDLTRYPPQNFYRNNEGVLYNLVRFHGREIMTMEDYARLERVEGYYGGQMASFEAVFSPRGPDGQPMPLFDRDTGRIDPFVQKAWERYDITKLLKTNWPRLGPRLQGKLHIIVGTQDTFHLEAGVHLLRDMLRGLGVAGESIKTTGGEKSNLPGGGYIEFIDGRDHFDLYNGGLADRIANEMFEVARPKARKPAPLRKAA